MNTDAVFNDMMGNFLNELIETFPEIDELRGYNTRFLIMKSTSPKTIVETFMTNIRPYKDQLKARDEDFFRNCDNSFLRDIRANEFWNDELSENSKNAIWEYLNQLYIIGSTVNAIPNELMSSIENVAQQMQKTMEDNPEAFNEMISSVMGNKDVFNALGNIMKK